MDELKNRAGEKLEALHHAAKTAADSSKSRVHDVYSQTAEAIDKICSMFLGVWQHELVLEARARAAAWGREAARRVREGAPPLSPLLLYDELVTLFHDRVWRRSAALFVCGVCVGACGGAALSLRAAWRPPRAAGPSGRALHSQPDHSVILVDDAVTPGAGAGEVVVRVQAFSVCSVDRSVLRGRGRALRALLSRSQITVGRGFAGIVLDVGPGVSRLELGDEVWGCVAEWAGGAAAELLTISSTRVSKRPRGMPADSAAALPWDGALVLRALADLDYTPDTCKGKRVAVCGWGGAGCSLVQVLARWGARVTVLAPHHANYTLKELGAQEFVDVSPKEQPCAWALLEARAARAGPWDAVLACDNVLTVAAPNAAALLKATAPRAALLDVRARALWPDRLVAPFSTLFAASFYSFRVLRWLLGYGWHTDWLEEPLRLSPGLDTLAQLVDSGQLTPILDKVYMPLEFETALAHACSEDAVGTSVVRFP